MANTNKHHSELAMGTPTHPLYSATRSVLVEILARVAVVERLLESWVGGGAVDSEG